MKFNKKDKIHEIPPAGFIAGAEETVSEKVKKSLDDLEIHHISRVDSSNPEFYLTAEDISLIRQFPEIMEEMEYIAKNRVAILKAIGE